jgi:hypothetical protein
LALKSSKPSVSSSDLNKYIEFTKSFGMDGWFIFSNLWVPIEQNNGIARTKGEQLDYHIYFLYKDLMFAFKCNFKE